MVLPQDIKAEVEIIVNQAVNNCIKSDPVMTQVVNRVTEAAAYITDGKLRNVEMAILELRNKYVELQHEFANKINSLQIELNDVDLLKNQLELKMDEFEQKAKKNNLRFFNVLEKPQENTLETIKTLLKATLSLDLTDNDIMLCYRVGKREQGKNRAIFLKLAKNEMKQEIYSKKRTFKSTGIIIREDLTQMRLELLKDTIEKLGIYRTWTLNGNICVNINQHVRLIKNKQDLDKILLK